MNLKLNGKRYKLRYVSGVSYLGECDPPSLAGKEIRINADVTGEKLLDSYLHEFLHALYWHIDEDHIAKPAEDLARALWRLGYRMKEDE